MPTAPVIDATEPATADGADPISASCRLRVRSDDRGARPGPGRAGHHSGRADGPDPLDRRASSTTAIRRTSYADIVAGAPNLVIVDARYRETFAREHLPGAINLPVREIDERTTAHLSRDAEYVVYCWNASCHASTKTAATPRVARLQGQGAPRRPAGLEEAGLPDRTRIGSRPTAPGPGRLDAAAAEVCGEPGTCGAYDGQRRRADRGRRTWTRSSCWTSAASTASSSPGASAS